MISDRHMARVFLAQTRATPLSRANNCRVAGQAARDDFTLPVGNIGERKFTRSSSSEADSVPDAAEDPVVNGFLECQILEIASMNTAGDGASKVAAGVPDFCLPVARSEFRFEGEFLAILADLGLHDFGIIHPQLQQLNGAVSPSIHPFVHALQRSNDLRYVSAMRAAVADHANGPVWTTLARIQPDHTAAMYVGHLPAQVWNRFDPLEQEFLELCGVACRSRHRISSVEVSPVHCNDLRDSEQVLWRNWNLLCLKDAAGCRDLMPRQFCALLQGLEALLLKRDSCGGMLRIVHLILLLKGSPVCIS